jgi:putative ABC transport system ATP-binding protein
MTLSSSRAVEGSGVTAGGASAGAAGSPQPVVELRDVRRTYYKPDGSVLVEALRGVTIAVPRGQYVAIMGSSGSGKSTMMNILGCLDRPTTGQYFLDGQETSKMSDEDVSAFRGRKIGFIFQAFNLIPELTIRENVEVPLFYQGVSPSERHRRAMEMLALVGLGDRTGHRPSELSGGQQQRSAIARALVTNPVVLMPTGNLDSATGRAVLGLFGRLHDEGKSIIMVTHDPDVAKLCQRVVRLRDGVIETDVMQVPERIEVSALSARAGGG